MARTKGETLMGRFSKYVDMQMRWVRQHDADRKADPSLPECRCEACIWFRGQVALAADPFKPVLPPKGEKAQHMIKRKLRLARNERNAAQKAKNAAEASKPPTLYTGPSKCDDCDAPATAFYRSEKHCDLHYREKHP